MLELLFKASLDYILSSRPCWANSETVSEKINRQKSYFSLNFNKSKVTFKRIEIEYIQRNRKRIYDK
jgi:hypothetical protein